MKINKKLQQLFKVFCQKIFFLFYGKILYHNDYDFLKDNKLNEIKRVRIDNLNYNCYIVNNGIIYTDLVQSVSVISNKNLIPGANFQKINNILVNDRENVCLTKGTPRIKKKIKGTVVSLIQDASGKNYSHWFLDILPKLEILNKIISIDAVDYFLMPELRYKFQYETLKALNIPLNKIIDSSLNRHLQAEKLIIIEHPWYNKGSVHDEMANVPTWIVKWLRLKFLNIIKNQSTNLKIFIDRSDSFFKHCQIINLKEVWNFLEKKGFKKYKLSEINFNEQISIFNSANTIVGAHGAGLANIIFSERNTKIIEIKPFDHQNQIFSKISDINNLDHKLMLTRNPIKKLKNMPGDIFVDIESLNRILDN
jgi:capsular polysaccharide biosynthesis protein